MMELQGYGELQEPNASTIAHLFVQAMKLLWTWARNHPGPDPFFKTRTNGVHNDRVLVSATDAARYMMKAAGGLKVLSPRMIHVTCVAHGLH